MADNRPIGLFDSGVGGLSILAQIKKILPQEGFVFLADQGHNPYGEKTKSQLQNLSVRITKFLLKYRIKLLVVACNTATCYALKHLRSRFKIPIIGTVPAIKPAAVLSRKKKVAIMSTPATAQSAYLSSLIDDFASGVDVFKLGCDGLEESVEYLETEEISRLLNSYVKQVKKFDADVVVLGCTHFPFIKGDIQKRLGPKVKIIDSGRSIAQRVRYLLTKNESLATKKLPDAYYTTSDPSVFSKVASTLLKYQVSAQKVNI